MIVNNNVPALRTFNTLAATNSALARSIQKLSTGLRINSAADDAAGLAISEKMRAQIRGLDRAVMNSQDGISMIQTAEGALNETHSILQRMRELSVQSANDTLTQQDRAYIQLEIDQLREEVTRIGNTTQFNTKKLLDGSAAVNWSSSDLGLRAIINGGLRTIDQFGQKESAEGNFRIEVRELNRGAEEHLKTNIFRLKHNVGTVEGTGDENQFTRLQGAQASTAVIGFSADANATATASDARAMIGNVSGGNWQVEMTITTSGGSIGATVDAANFIGTNGVAGTVTFSSASLTSGTITLTVEDTGETMTINLGNLSNFLSAGAASDDATFTLFASSANGANTGIEVAPDGLSVPADVGSVIYNFVSTEVRGETVDLFDDMHSAGSEAMIFSSDFGAVGDVAVGDHRLRDLQQFWNSEGRFMLNDPQTLTFTLGNGRSASLTLYGDDTLNDVVRKINDLGHPEFGSMPINAFFRPDTTGNAVAGTIELHSLLSGADGRISVAGSEDMVRALGLSALQRATETTYEVRVTDAHTDAPVGETGWVQITGQRLIGIVHQNVDVVFDQHRLSEEFTNADGDILRRGTFFLHLADNTTVFQIGANEGEDMGINIGDMRSEALGLNAVLVTNRESAARSITIIDNAIDRVSMQRARLGAFQNRLEHTINNLSVAGENLTAAESRIRDTDMAREMMNFTRLSIMLQAGTSMLAQANQMPQSVLGLIR